MNTKDVSDKSMRLLEGAVTQFLGARPWVPDWGTEFTSHQINGAPAFTSALVMGSYFERVFQPQFWPDHSFELFCLSPAVKNILVNIFNFDEEVVGCFSRYDLFPKGKADEVFQLSPETALYYAGRISPQKNIEFLILTFFYLQLLYSSKLTLTLVGDFDNEYHKDIQGCPFGDYKNKITSLITGLPWCGQAPVFVHEKNEQEWTEFIPKKGVFISCSNLISEDFSVTVAQLEEKGRAMILPYWGGMTDVCATNVHFYPVDLIAHSHLDLKHINSWAKTFAQKLMVADFLTVTNFHFSTFFPEKKIDREYLVKKISENRKKWGMDIDLLVENKLPQFVLTKTGQKIFEECRKVFKRPV